MEYPQSVRAFIGIGSNLEDPVTQVQRAFVALRALPDSVLVACSSLYRTAPVGGPPDQPDYINAVAALDTALSPHALLHALQVIESAHGRIRTVRWGPRTLDLDILLYGAHVSNDPLLTLPHPRMHERAFVLIPLREIAPTLMIPGSGVWDGRLHRAVCDETQIERLSVVVDAVAQPDCTGCNGGDALG